MPLNIDERGKADGAVLNADWVQCVGEHLA